MQVLRKFVVAIWMLTFAACGLGVAGDWEITSPIANTEFAQSATFTASGTGEEGQQYSVIMTFCRHSGTVECSRDAQVDDEYNQWMIEGDNKFEPSTTWQLDAPNEHHKLKLCSSENTSTPKTIHNHTVVND